MPQSPGKSKWWVEEAREVPDTDTGAASKHSETAKMDAFKPDTPNSRRVGIQLVAQKTAMGVVMQDNHSAIS